MCILISGTQIRTRQSPVGKRGSVRSAAECQILRFHAAVFNCLNQIFHKPRYLIDHFLHGTVGLFDLQCYNAFPVFPVQLIRDLSQIVFPVFKFHGTVITDNHGQFRMFTAAVEGYHMIEAFPAVGKLRLFKRRQHSHEFSSDIHGIDHNALGSTGMHASSGNGHFSGTGIECFILIVSEIIPVQRIGCR